MLRSNSWLDDEEYVKLCIKKVCDQLGVINPSDCDFIEKIALHSQSDGQFFYRVKLYYSIQPSNKVAKKEKEEMPKITVVMGEYNDGKKTGLPNLLEARLRELRSDD